MLTGVTAILVGDLADIDPVVQQPVNMGGVPFGAFAHFAFLGGPGLGAVSLFVQLLAQLLGRTDLDEPRPLHCFLRVFVKSGSECKGR